MHVPVPVPVSEDGEEAREEGEGNREERGEGRRGEQDPSVGVGRRMDEGQ